LKALRLLGFSFGLVVGSSALVRAVDKFVVRRKSTVPFIEDVAAFAGKFAGLFAWSAIDFL